MLHRLSAVICSVILLSAGWLGIGGLSLLAAFVPLLAIADSYDDSRRSWFGMFGWALLTFVLWNAATIWWIWNATWVGPFAATLASSFLNMVAFMLFFTASKRLPRAASYVILAAAWITTEYWYTVGEFSFPWLILGNGFCEIPWAVQWYEYTGVFGGSLWVLASNILIYEAWRQRRKMLWGAAAAAVLLPLALSLTIYGTYTRHMLSDNMVRVAVVQPNVDCYDKFHGDVERQESNILDLIDGIPSDVDFIALPETALTDYLDEDDLDFAPIVDTIAGLLRSKGSHATVVTGANTFVRYPYGPQSRTARRDRYGYYDLFNSALSITPEGDTDIYHKSRLVIGAEKTPLPKLFEWLSFLVIDLGGTVGQLGVGTEPKVFGNEVKTGPSICYEALYGDFYGGFIRKGAQFMLVISNDGWWGDTPGYKRLFAFCRLRAVEHRRAIARSANTGISGFISERGDDGQRLGWDKRGVLIADLPLNDRITFYTRHGDYIGRCAQLPALLGVLALAAAAIRRRTAHNRKQ